MTSKYKLIYLDFAGFGEPIRWIFQVAKVNFDDERIPLHIWPSRKFEFPLGNVPILYEDGIELSQSNAIIRYLCRKFGFVSDNPLLQFRSDQVGEIMVDTKFIDLISRPHFREKDPERKKELKDQFLSALPRTFDQVSRILSETPGKFIAGDTLTSGDFILSGYCQAFVKVVDPHLLDDQPKLKEHMEAMLDVPEIKEWILVRPPSSF